ncbi:uncharacterized protein LOC144915075 [Branchiostoma floridae x Branchiostoma belcheri]
MRILRRTRGSFCLVLTAGVLLSFGYILVAPSNPREVKNKNADRLNTIPISTVMDHEEIRGDSSSFPASYLSTHEVDKFANEASTGTVERLKVSVGTGERISVIRFNTQSIDSVPTAELIDRDTDVLRIEEAAVHTEVSQDGKPVQTLTRPSRDFNNDLRNEAGVTEVRVSKRKTGDELANVLLHGKTYSKVENVNEKSLPTTIMSNSAQKRKVDSDGEARKYSQELPLCKYPDLQMQSSEFNYLFENITDLYCGHDSIDYLTYLDETSRTKESPWDLVKLNFSAILPTQKLLNCTYSKVTRFDDYQVLYTTLHTEVFESNEISLQFPFKDQFAKVNCFLEQNVFNQTQQAWVKVIREHNNMFVQVVRNENLVEDKRAIIEKEGRMKKALGHGMNVLMVGVDSTSRMNFMRKLPQTFKYFTETLEGHVLKGYHVIGDGTTAQFLGMLSGFHEEELPNAKTGVANSTTCDVFPLVWKKFRRMGYTTMHAEDEAWSGTFTFRIRGFEEQPTDHYMRTFWVAQEQLPESDEWYCFGATPKHHYTLKYARDFVEAYHDIPKFAIAFHTELSHDSLNMVQVADEDILTLIKSWKDKGYLDNTVFILFADHGARYGGLRKLLQGRLEERLPFFGIAVPPWVKKRHPEIVRNLKKNEERLTTAFDFHKTLQHIMDYPGDPASFQGHGISLFQEIPLNRTCENASIADHWCTCLQSVPVDIRNKVVREAAEFAVSYMNRLTELHRSLCAVLFLKNITHAEVVKPNQKLLQFAGSDRMFRNALFGKNLDVPFLDFRITLETGPNGGAYEVSVKKWLSDSRAEITGDISRINVYGNHPKCIQDKFPRLRKYCFCREFLEPVPPE